MPARGHGHTAGGRSPTYQSWRSAKERCYREKHPYYERYGGRGIEVDERWLGKTGFATFLADMGERPSLYHSLERVEHNGNYTKDNCKWATEADQQNNRDGNRLVEVGGEMLSLSRAVDRFGARSHYSAIVSRIARGWDPLTAIQTPIMLKRKGTRRGKRTGS